MRGGTGRRDADNCWSSLPPARASKQRHPSCARGGTCLQGGRSRPSRVPPGLSGWRVPCAPCSPQSLDRASMPPSRSPPRPQEAQAMRAVPQSAPSSRVLSCGFRRARQERHGCAPKVWPALHATSQPSPPERAERHHGSGTLSRRVSARRACASSAHLQDVWHRCEQSLPKLSVCSELREVEEREEGESERSTICISELTLTLCDIESHSPPCLRHF